MEKPFCPACKNNNGISIIVSKLFEHKDLAKCKKCGLVFLWPPPEIDTVSKIYQREYYDAWNMDDLGNDSLSAMKRQTSEKILDMVERFKCKGTLLDVGCAFGYLLESAQKRNWEVLGVEMSEYASGEAQKKIGIGKVMTGDFLGMALPKSYFDVITMVDVIEHVFDTELFLKKCLDLLKPSGLLVIVTPNLGGLLYKCLGNYWPHFNSAHVTYFSTKSIDKVLKMNGFRVLFTTSFKKALNFHYIKGVTIASCKKPLVLITRILNYLLPGFLKHKNVFLPHGEIFVAAQRSSLRHDQKHFTS